jgi:hypothetical protein
MLLKSATAATIGLTLAMLLAGTAEAHIVWHSHHHHWRHQYSHRHYPISSRHRDNGHDKTGDHGKDNGHDRGNATTK